MILATIESVQEINGQYGPEKVSAITCDDGQQTKVYTKPKAQAIYANLLPGIRVELTPKASGVGYLIKRILPEGEAPAPAQNGYAGPAKPAAAPTKQDIAAFIETSAGQYAYCVKCLREKFEEVGITDITDDLLKAGATSIFISTKDKFR